MTGEVFRYRAFISYQRDDMVYQLYFGTDGKPIKSSARAMACMCITTRWAGRCWAMR